MWHTLFGNRCLSFSSVFFVLFQLSLKSRDFAFDYVYRHISWIIENNERDIYAFLFLQESSSYRRICDVRTLSEHLSGFLPVYFHQWFLSCCQLFRPIYSWGVYLFVGFFLPFSQLIFHFSHLFILLDFFSNPVDKIFCSKCQSKFLTNARIYREYFWKPNIFAWGQLQLLNTVVYNHFFYFGVFPAILK